MSTDSDVLTLLDKLKADHAKQGEYIKQLERGIRLRMLFGLPLNPPYYFHNTGTRMIVKEVINGKPRGEPLSSMPIKLIPRNLL